MSLIARQLQNPIEQRLADGKAIVVYGARQVGKTTLVNELLAHATSVLRMNGDASDVRALLADVTPTRWRQLIGSHRILFLDEAQRINDIGVKLKMLVDEKLDVIIIASGSSSFELANRINEPMTGRKWEFCLTPLSFQEMVIHHGLLEERRCLAQRLVFGSYPEIVTHPDQAQDRLRELASDYLYQDVLQSGRIKKSEKLEVLVKALAFQVGSQVSYNELARLCSLDGKTVENYIDILEKAFIVFRLPSFSRNLRNELKFTRKIYFYDCGIRNAVIGNLSPIETRSDTGQLWENYLVSERRKNHLNSRSLAVGYFWRTRQQQEIDYVEENAGRIEAFEFKWNPHAKSKRTGSFKEAYNLAEIPMVTPKNYDEFLSSG